MASPARDKRIARTARGQQASRGDATGEQGGQNPTASGSDLDEQQRGHNPQARASDSTRPPAQQDRQYSGSGPTQQGTSRTTLAIRSHPSQGQVAPGPEHSETQMGRCNLPQQDDGSAGPRKRSPARGAQIPRSAMTQEAPGSSGGRFTTPRSSRGGQTSGERKGKEHKPKGDVSPRFRGVANESWVAPVSNIVGQRIDLSCSPITERRKDAGLIRATSAQRLELFGFRICVRCRLDPEGHTCSRDVTSLVHIVTRYNEEVAQPKKWPVMKPAITSPVLSLERQWLACLIDMAEGRFLLFMSPRFDLNDLGPTLTDGSSFWERNCDATWKFLHESCRQLRSRPEPFLKSSMTEFIKADEEGLDLSEIQRFCAAIIHFESILTSILDSAADPQRSNPGSSRPAIRSRAEAIDVVQSFRRAKDVVEFMDAGYKNGWQFRQTSTNHHDLMYHRLAREGTTAEEAIRHANVVTSFFRAALLCRDIPSLRRYPATVHGLRSFMSGRPSNPIGGL